MLFFLEPRRGAGAGLLTTEPKEFTEGMGKRQGIFSRGAGPEGGQSRRGKEVPGIFSRGAGPERGQSRRGNAKQGQSFLVGLGPASGKGKGRGGSHAERGQRGTGGDLGGDGRDGDGPRRGAQWTGEGAFFRQDLHDSQDWEGVTLRMSHPGGYGGGVMLENRQTKTVRNRLHQSDAGRSLRPSASAGFLSGCKK